MLSRQFIAALWSPARQGLTSWLLFVILNCVFVTLPCSILGNRWYLIVSIPYLCRLSYFTYALHFILSVMFQPNLAGFLDILNRISEEPKHQISTLNIIAIHAQHHANVSIQITLLDGVDVGLPK